MTISEKAWYVPENAIWDGEYWRLPILEPAKPEEA